MARTTRVTISIPDAELLRWAKQRAKAANTSLSAIITEGIRAAKRDLARKKVLEYLGDAATLTDEDRARVDAELGIRTPRKTRVA